MRLLQFTSLIRVADFVSLVCSTHPDLAGKITGMLLEMDNAEILRILDSQEAMDAKVQEAINVLTEYSKDQPE